MERLRRRHDDLRRAVKLARALFAGLAPPDMRSPERAELVAVFEQTGALAIALADFLDALDRALCNEGSGASGPGSSPEEVRALLGELEPVPASERDASFHPGVPRHESPIGALPAFYGQLIDLANRLHIRRQPSSFAWRQTVDLWQAMTYCGGTTGTGGLLRRLDRIAELPGVRRTPRSSAYYPWDRDDIAELRRIAARAAHLTTVDDAALLADERRAWCDLIDGWLQAAPSIGGAADPVISTIIEDTPAPDAAIRERLGRIAELAHLSKETRRRARARIG